MLACVTHFSIVLILKDGKGIMCSSHEVFADPSKCKLRHYLLQALQEKSTEGSRRGEVSLT